MIFQRRHYEKIAATFREARPERAATEHWAAWAELCVRFARMFKADNENFQAERFFSACGLDFGKDTEQ